MIGALIGDLAASTWENDKQKFFSELVGEGCIPSIYGETLLQIASSNIPGIKKGPCIRIAEPEILTYIGQWMMQNIASTWLDKNIESDFVISSFIDKPEGYAKHFVVDLIQELRKGSSKSEAFHNVWGFENLIKGMGWKWKVNKVPEGSEQILTYVFRAWDSFYRGFDFTSSLHNAMKWSGDKHLLGILTGAFADAMYGCGYIFLKKKYSKNGQNLKSCKLPKSITSLGFDKSLYGELYKISYTNRKFFSKNNALTNVEWHHWTSVTNILEEIRFSEGEHDKIMKSAPTSWDCRFGFYLDDGWHYIYRSRVLIARFRMEKDDDKWKICNWQLSGELSFKDGISAFVSALYEGCRIINHRVNELCQYSMSCKYFQGEQEVPQKWKDTTNEKFWYGEFMFITSLSDFKPWEETATTLTMNLKGAKKDSFQKYTEQQKAIVCYIETLFNKWCPYDNLDWILEY